MSHSNSSPQILEKIKKDLRKLNQESNIKLSESYIDEVTSSIDSFNLALKKEAQAIWDGMQTAFRKDGASQDFLIGFLKEGEELLKHASYKIGDEQQAPTAAPPVPVPPKPPAPAPPKAPAPAPAPKPPQAGNNPPGFLDRAWDATTGAFKSFSNDRLLPGYARQPEPAAAPQKQPAAPPLSPQGDSSPGSSQENDSGLLGLGSGTAGGLGGFLLTYLMGQMMGLEGPAAFLIPMLGGVTGYNFFKPSIRSDNQ